MRLYVGRWKWIKSTLAVGMGIGVLLVLYLGREPYPRPLHPRHTGLQSGDPALKPLASAVVVVIIDSLRADQAFDARHMPFLNQLKAEGAWGVSWTGPQTYSVPGLQAIFAGYRSQSPIPKPPGFYLETLPDSFFKRARQAGLRVLGAGWNDWQSLFAGQLDDFIYVPYVHHEEGPPADEDIVASTLAALRGRSHDVVAIHLYELDNMGHSYGPQHEKSLRELRKQDVHLEAIAAALKPGTVLLITSDHGMADDGGHGSAHADCRKTPFVFWGAGIRRGGPFEIDQVDLAPTLTAIFGLSPPELSQGRPLTQALLIDPGGAAALLRSSLGRAIDYWVSVRPLSTALGEMRAASARGRLLESDGRLPDAISEYRRGFEISRELMGRSAIPVSDVLVLGFWAALLFFLSAFPFRRLPSSSRAPALALWLCMFGTVAALMFYPGSLPLAVALIVEVSGLFLMLDLKHGALRAGGLLLLVAPVAALGFLGFQARAVLVGGVFFGWLLWGLYAEKKRASAALPVLFGLIATGFFLLASARYRQLAWAPETLSIKGLRVILCLALAGWPLYRHGRDGLPLATLALGSLSLAGVPHPFASLAALGLGAVVLIRARVPGEQRWLAAVIGCVCLYRPFARGWEDIAVIAAVLTQSCIVSAVRSTALRKSRVFLGVALAAAMCLAFGATGMKAEIDAVFVASAFIGSLPYNAAWAVLSVAVRFLAPLCAVLVLWERIPRTRGGVLHLVAALIVLPGVARFCGALLAAEPSWRAWEELLFLVGLIVPLTLVFQNGGAGRNGEAAAGRGSPSEGPSGRSGSI